MKNLFRISVLLIPFSVHAQNPIPNPSFEYWQYTPIWSIEADGWQSNNSEVAAWNVVPDSNAHSGNLALGIVNYSYRGQISCSFSLTEHPLMLNGYVRCNLASTDSSLIRVSIFSQGSLVDSGIFIFTGGCLPSYTAFGVPITQQSAQADSGVIFIEGGNQPLSGIAFDDLNLSFLSGIPDAGDDHVLSIYPNPCSNQLMIQAKDGMPFSFILFDQNGQSLNLPEQENLQNPPESGVVTLKMNDLPAGTYLLNLRNTHGLFSRKIVCIKE